MIFYVPAFIYLLYDLYKRRSKTTLFLIVLCVLSAVAYMGVPSLFIEPIPAIFPTLALICVLYLIFLSWREYKVAKINYLKERRMLRENAAPLRKIDEDHERIVIKDRKTSEQKVIYLKRDGKNVPRGTNEENKSESETENKN
ncbi:hypothetical protein [Aedoeadaptatus pacaensis]|uniref:hypothetical protein n=1 Tax=Aedoeadaptatus pacaensis TaxID=1776390 RepID=UPI0008383005|nr:hypothetical protein [Peptoniphilus pacaensis]